MLCTLLALFASVAFAYVVLLGVTMAGELTAGARRRCQMDESAYICLRDFMRLLTGINLRKTMRYLT
jgi:hypothetical protein